MNRKFFWKIISIIRVWFQSFLSIEVAMHIKDLLDGRLLWQVCIAAFIPVLIRWATPSDRFPDEEVR
jgi:hypothetical protein